MSHGDTVLLCWCLLVAADKWQIGIALLIGTLLGYLI